MRTRTLFIILLAALYAKAQDSNNDFGLDANLSIVQRLFNNRLSFEAAGEFRSQKNTTRAERYVVGMDINYKFIDKKKYSLKAGFGYEYHWIQNLSETTDVYKEKPRHVVYGDKFDYVGNGEFSPHIDGYTSGYNTGYNSTESYWRQRSRLNIHAAFTYKPKKRLSLTLKETLQCTHYNSCSANREEYRIKFRTKERYDDNGALYSYDEIEESSESAIKNWDSKDRFMLRSKISGQYEIKKSPFAPYLSADYGIGLGYYAHKIKATVGTDIRIDKHNSIEVFYRFQTETDDDEPNGHLIGIGYQLKL